MKLSLLKTVLLSLAAGSYGWEHKGHEWHPPLPDDSRSPCPGLNAMANHGWLPRSGKNIDLAALQSAVAGAYNYAPTSFDDIFALTLGFNLTTTRNSSTINLVDLARHDNIEIDGSLSRNDIYFGDNLHFDPAIWATMAKNLRLYETLGSKIDNYVTVEAAAKARAARVADAKRINPTFNASAMQIQGSPGTTGLYLTTLWDDEAGAAPKTWVRAFFEEERIPYLEGYRGPITPRTMANITEMTKRVSEVEVLDTAEKA